MKIFVRILLIGLLAVWTWAVVAAYDFGHFMSAASDGFGKRSNGGYLPFIGIWVAPIALFFVNRAFLGRAKTAGKNSAGKKMDARENMDAALKQLVIPALREKGFTGSFPHFRRIKEEEVDLLTFQFDRNGGGFVIEIAKGNKGGFTTHWGKHIPATKLRAWDLHPNQRKRLQPGADGGTESWFRYDASQDCDAVALVALSMIQSQEADP